MATVAQRRRLFATVAMAASLAGCATLAALQGPPEDTPPEAPNARVLRFLPPDRRDEVFPPVTRYSPVDWLDRLVCPVGDQPGWKRTARDGVVGHYEVDCPGETAREVVLDAGTAAPAPPKGMRLLDPAGFPKYRDAMLALSKKDSKTALADLDEARKLSPHEPVYERERLYALFSLGRTPEALVGADALLETHPSPIVWKYRALAARDLGLGSEVLTSLDGILRSCPATHPLYAEAECAKGMFLATDDEPKAEALMADACRLKSATCCEELDARRAERARAAAALAAQGALPIHLTPGKPDPQPAAAAASSSASTSTSNESPKKPSKVEPAP